MLSVLSRSQRTSHAQFRATKPDNYLSFSIYRTSSVELPFASWPGLFEQPEQAHSRPAVALSSATSQAPSQLDFNNARTAFQAKSVWELARGLSVFGLCRRKAFVDHAEQILGASKVLLGPGLTHWAVKQSFFGHFCAGESEQAIQPRVASLRANGISPILCYSVEDDVGSRGFNDASCDANMRRFLRSVDDTDVSGTRGIIAAKVSALGSPDLLQKMTRHLVAVGDDLDRGRFSVDLRGTLSAALTPAELGAFDRIVGRLETLATAARDKGNMRVMIDAEQSWLQPAEDALVIALQQRFNRSLPIVYNTYQCYLKSTPQRLQTDLARAEREGWRLGLKTVRGAYLHGERALAGQQGQPCPVHDSLEDTHASYNRCVEMVLERVAQGQAELLVATHNQQSVELALAAMQRLGIEPSPQSGTGFATLMGMADHLAYTLGGAGHNAFKMVPYGPVPEVMAFLLRRARENSDALGGCGKELGMMRGELARRLFSWPSAEAPPAVQAA